MAFVTRINGIKGSLIPKVMAVPDLSQKANTAKLLSGHFHRYFISLLAVVVRIVVVIFDV